MEYVTYAPDGKLTGAFMQEVHASHLLNYIPVTSDQRLNWTLYRANAARNGLELAPVLPPPVVVPASVTRRQALQALLLNGYTAANIEAAITAAMTGITRELALIEFRESLEFERNRPLVMQIGSGLGLNLDALFIQAATL